MKSAVISGDIISYTALNKAEKIKLDNELQLLLRMLNKKYNVFGRIIKGDYIECYIPKTEQVLRIALIIKTFIKNAALRIKSGKPGRRDRIKLFQTYGIRLAVGIGDLSRLDVNEGVMDGEAIYYTGRLISGTETSNKERVSVKNSIFIKIYDDNLNNEFVPLITLLDKIISDTTAKQSEVMFYKLQGFSETEIAKIVNVSQSAINQHSTSAGWNAIEKAVLRFEKVIKEKIK